MQMYEAIKEPKYHNVNSIVNLAGYILCGYALLNNDVIYTNLSCDLKLPWAVHIPQGHHVTATPWDISHWAWITFCSLRNTRLSPVWGQSSLQQSIEGRAFGNKTSLNSVQWLLLCFCASKSSFKPVSQHLEPDLVIDKFCIWSNWQLIFFKQAWKLFSNWFLFIINNLRRSNLFAI